MPENLALNIKSRKNIRIKWLAVIFNSQFRNLLRMELDVCSGKKLLEFPGSELMEKFSRSMVIDYSC